MVPDRRIDTQVRRCPRRSLAPVDVPVFVQGAPKRQVAGDEKRVRLLLRDPVHQPFANPRVRVRRVRRIGKAHVAIGDDLQIVARLDFVDDEGGFAREVGRSVAVPASAAKSCTQARQPANSQTAARPKIDAEPGVS